jgi:hypothetical protein
MKDKLPFIKKFDIKVNGYDIAEGREYSLDEAKDVVRELQKNPKFVADRKAKRFGANFITITAAGASVDTYKGNKLAHFSDIGPDFVHSTTRIANSYSIDGNKIEIQNIKVMTASNGSEPCDTLTSVKPIETDTVSTENSADRFVWYSVVAKIGGKEIKSGWLCWNVSGNALYAAQNAAFNVASHVGAYASGVARALESVYQTKTR